MEGKNNYCYLMTLFILGLNNFLINVKFQILNYIFLKYYSFQFSIIFTAH